MGIHENLERVVDNFRGSLLAEGIQPAMADKLIELLREKIREVFPKERMPDTRLAKQYLEGKSRKRIMYIEYKQPLFEPILNGIFDPFLLESLTKLANNHGMDIDKLVGALNLFVDNAANAIESNSYRAMAPWNWGKLLSGYDQNKVARAIEEVIAKTKEYTTDIVANLDKNFERFTTSQDVLVAEAKGKNEAFLHNLFAKRTLGGMAGPIMLITPRIDAGNEIKDTPEYKLVYLIYLNAVRYGTNLAFQVE